MPDDDLLARFHLARLRDVVATWERPAILGDALASSQPDAKVGTRSYAGGHPLVPANFEWPRKDENGLDFLLQIDLEDLPENDDLPKQGLLSLFYDPRFWGAGARDAGHVRAFLFDLGAPLREAQPPSWEKTTLFGLRTKTVTSRTYRQTPLQFRSGKSWPSEERAAIEFTDEVEMDSWFEASMELGAFVQLLGWPRPVQSDTMEEETVEALGLGQPEDWRLLLQLGEDAATDMMWGDAGELYVFIRQEDLAAARFDQIWLIMQCH